MLAKALVVDGVMTADLAHFDRAYAVLGGAMAI
jgi:hypothetical protein